MTVSSIEPVNTYTGDLSNTKFDFDFLIEKAEELIVQHTDSDGKITILKNGTDYSINEIGDKNGSYITFPIEGSKYKILSHDERISLMLTLVIKQEKEIRNSLFFNFDLLEWMFDYIIRILQILNRKIERAVKIQEGSPMTADELLEVLKYAQNEAQYYSNSARDSADAAEGFALTAKKYSMEAQFGMKWVRFTQNNWVLNNSKYILFLADIAIVNAIYKSNGENQYQVKNVDIEITTHGINLISNEAFDGYILTAANTLGSYTHTQTLASNEWVINHNLGYYPCITVTDDNYTVMECTKIYNSLNRITLQFADTVTGKVFLR